MFKKICEKITGRFEKIRKVAKEYHLWKKKCVWLKHARGFAVKYGYYAGLAVLLVMLGFASSAYRERGLTGSTSDDMPPVEAAAVITPVPTQTPAPAATQAPPEYVWPLDGAVIQGYSDRDLVWSETLAQWQTHPAYDISAAAGESVSACGDGIIKDVYSDPMWGNVIVIAHDDGMESVYANLNTLNLVKVGEEVSSGETISAVGKSAAAEAEMPWHLHFEFKNDRGESVDFSLFAQADKVR